MADPAVRRCQSRSPYGDCGRGSKHNGPHAVPIGPGFWFGYERGGIPLGYGHLHGDAFKPHPQPDTEEDTDRG